MKYLLANSFEIPPRHGIDQIQFYLIHSKLALVENPDHILIELSATFAVK